MYDAPTRNYLGGGSARDFRRQMGQGMTKEAFAEDQDWRRENIAQMARMQRQQRHQQTLLGMQTRSDEAVAGMERDADLGVADKEAEAAMYGADAQAGAAKYGANMDFFGNLAQSVGGVVGNWLNRGIEKLRQEGQTDRLERMMSQSGVKTMDGGDGVQIPVAYQDATGRASMLPQQEQQKPLSPLGKLTVDYRSGLISEEDYNRERERMTKGASGSTAKNPHPEGSDAYYEWEAMTPEQRAAQKGAGKESGGAQQFVEGKVYADPQTGERRRYVNGQFVKVN